MRTSETEHQVPRGRVQSDAPPLLLSSSKQLTNDVVDLALCAVLRRPLPGCRCSLRRRTWSRLRSLRCGASALALALALTSGAAGKPLNERADAFDHLVSLPGLPRLTRLTVSGASEEIRAEQ